MMFRVVDDFFRQCLPALGLAVASDVKLVVGVSGGADSLALLHVLQRLWRPDCLLVGHLNHGWRQTAVTDAQFVTQTAAAWGVACVVETADVPGLARAGGLSLEQAGRQARYRFLARLAQGWGATAVLVAHNAEDQAETVLMNLLRGAGLTGLSGMKPVAPLPEAPHVPLLRPFLNVSRAEIEAYCRAHQLTPVEDSTNRDTTYFRNRLRHELMPTLARYNPQIQTHLQQLAQLAAADDALLEQLLDDAWPELLVERQGEWLVLDRAAWLNLPLSLRRRALRRATAVTQPSLSDLSFAAVEQARAVAEQGRGGAQSTLAADLMMRVDYGRLLFYHSFPSLQDDWPQLPAQVQLPLPVPGIVPLANGWQIEAAPITIQNLDEVWHNKDPWQAFVVVAEALWVRGRRPGESFQPLGLGGHSATLKKVMINRKISAEWRANWPLVTTANQIVWLVGHQIDERFKAEQPARNLVWLRCRRM